MKTRDSLILLLIAFGLACFGCKKEAGANIETSRVESAFSGAEPSLKATADKAVDAVKKGDYSTAVTELKNLASNAKLTDSQKQAVNDMIAQVQKALSEGASKAIGDAKKAIGQ